MRTAFAVPLALFVLVPAFALAQEPVPPPSLPEERKSRITTSANGRYTVQLVEELPAESAEGVTGGEAPAADGGVPPAGAPPTPPAKRAAKKPAAPPQRTCRLEVATQDGLAWTLRRCVGGVDDLYFISNDGERVWVLFPFPERQRGGGWREVRGALLVDRRGEVRATKKLGELVPREGRDDVRLLARHLKWIEGLMGVPGKPPRVTDAERLEFETVGGTTKTFPFR